VGDLLLLGWKAAQILMLWYRVHLYSDWRLDHLENLRLRYLIHGRKMGLVEVRNAVQTVNTGINTIIHLLRTLLRRQHHFLHLFQAPLPLPASILTFS
jgi:hypothetical protein